VNPYIVAMLKRDEGVRLKPYTDTVGKLTIGVGRNLTDVGISEAECETLLANDIAKCEADAERFHWYAGLDDARKAVVLNMIFNLGAGAFRSFTNTIKAIEAGDYQDAAERMTQSLWARQVGARAARLAQIMRTGVVP
jgi:lysozyme